jgi:ubiquitin-conjugating enzyme E2 D/E
MQVLLSIQSLLTDPFCEVCMEPEIGELYLTDKPSFEAVARYTVYRYPEEHNFNI